MSEYLGIEHPGRAWPADVCAFLRMLEQARVAKSASRSRDWCRNCWSCGRFVWTRADVSYICTSCDVRQAPLGDSATRERSRVIELATQRQQFKIDNWIDHGDPRQRLPSPA